MRFNPTRFAPVVAWIYRLWMASLRPRVMGLDRVRAVEAKEQQIVFALWHNEFVAGGVLYKAIRVLTMVSQSKDGEFLSRVFHSLGVPTARGSSSRGGVKALLMTCKIMRSEHLHTAVALDGPRGPRHEVKPGVFLIAQRAPALITPVRLFTPNAHVFEKSWDRFRLPWPGSRVLIIFGEPYALDGDKLDEEGVARESARLKEKLHELRNEARENLSPKDRRRFKLEQ